MPKIFSSRQLLLFLSIILIPVLSACGQSVSSASATVEALPTLDRAVSYSKDIAPILQNSCYNCHGGEKTEKGFSVAGYDALMKGSQHGAMIIAGDPAKSKMYQQVLSGRMPKRGTPKLTPEQLQLIQQWIQAGAQNN